MVVLDAILIAAAYFLLVVLRFDASIPDTYWRGFGWFLLLAVVSHLFFNVVFGLYAEMWRHASVEEAGRVLLAGGSALVMLTIVTLVDRSRTPLSIPVIGGLLATGGIGIVRFQSRLFALKRRSVPSSDAVSVAVIGAGERAAHLVREMRREQSHRPVVVLDDDRRKWGMSLLGVPVTGPIERLPEIAAVEAIDSAILAIGQPSGSLVRSIEDLTASCALSLKILPSVDEMFGASPSIRDVRDLEITDLLGRAEVTTDLDRVRRTLEGKVVLVTGAGGSIGSEIVRQVAKFEPAVLVLLDCDETHLHDAMAKVVTAPTTCHPELVNIRDADRVREVFRHHRPDVVLHAAALKHVPVLESNAREAVRTNVLGLAAVIDAAIEVDVERFVFVSTDKAVNPSSVMGATKWLGEQMLMSRAPDGAPWCCVRFGNVLGSRGSVLPTFERQIREGGPVTVTDERMTRYFMSVQEAVQLVLQAGAMAEFRSIYMLEMGEPVVIADLARRMIRLTGRRPGADVPIVFTGVRRGEKLHEQLHTGSEQLAGTDHPSIRRLVPELMTAHELDRLLESMGQLSLDERDAAIAARLREFMIDADTDVIDLRDPSTTDHDAVVGFARERTSS